MLNGLAVHTPETAGSGAFMRRGAAPGPYLILPVGNASIHPPLHRKAVMNAIYATPQDAEDAYYDALEAGDLQRLLGVWADSEDICCLLPMYPLIQGRAGVKEVFSHLFSQGQGVELSINHLNWIQTAEIAIHHIEEAVQNPPEGAPPPPPFYATNIYRKVGDGWRLISHQNAPTPAPPPPDLVMPD